MENFDIKFETFLEGLKQKSHHGFTFTTGKRYIKVIHHIYHAQSVYCFVDRTNGDVLKAASWNAPAKHARGNIFDEFNGLKLCGEWGPAYLR